MAQEDALPEAQPPMEVSEAPKTAPESAVEPAPEKTVPNPEAAKADGKAQSQAEAKTEPKAEPKTELKSEAKSEAGVQAKTETQAEGKVEPKAEAPEKSAKKSVKQASTGEILAGEFQALKDGAEDVHAELRAASLDNLRVFLQQHPDAEQAPEAMAILARQEEYRPAMVDWLHLVYEYPDSKFAQKAKSEYLDIVNKKMKGKLQPGLRNLIKTPEAADKPERLAQLIYGLAENSGDALYEPVLAEARRLQVRFPLFKDGDRIHWSLAQLHLNNGKYYAVLMAYRQLLAYEGSSYRERSQFAMADLYSEKLKKYKEAVDAFQEFIDRYPPSAQVPSALERMAVLYADRLEQPLLAVETYERLIKLFPKTDGALKAFNAEARIYRERLKQPEEAIKTYRRLAEQFLYPAAAEALMNAAEVCRKDLKDFKGEVELRRKVALEFPTAKEAPEQLYQAAQAAEDDLKDTDGAIKLYQETAAKFGVHKLGKKAADRAEKLAKKQGG
ncbi:MAG TPA: hypothetical protein DEB40_11250 [Elusimicrobia bacterium]|nr:hypothetical protein [Elusimicrobiota bacterium]HBT62308.1 hypothetical protein [Elusimicrobiota bacterium]